MDFRLFSSNSEIKALVAGLDIDMISECPMCHSKIRLEDALTITNDVENNHDLSRRLIIFECPNEECKELFVARYSESWYYNTYKNVLNSIFPNQIEINIDKIIEDISPNYAEIYRQAQTAQKQGLNQICGVGYRKALEFLIKDYCVKKNPEKQDNIRSLELSKVIGQYVDNINIKDMAKRAVWIGNDETHYIRKWEDKDIKDLLNLIDLTSQWIILNEKTKMYTLSMPKGR